MPTCCPAQKVQSLGATWRKAVRPRAPVRHLIALSACSALVACGGSGDKDTASPAAAVPSKTAASLVASVNQFAANGWFWNPAEGGTGFMFEAQGNKGFVAFFMYEEGTGKPVWYAADGAFVANADGSYSFNGDLRYYTGGQAVSSPTYVVPKSVSIGAVSIQFNGNGGTVLLPGGRTINGTRYDFAGLGSKPAAAQPEVGWYYNPAEGGRGYAIEVQNNKVFMAMFHYNEDGSPTWHVVDGDISSGVVTNPFQLFGGGQSLSSAYRTPKQQVNLGSYTLSFRNNCAGQVQLAGTPAVGVRRFVFGDLPAGFECRTVQASQVDVPPDATTSLRMEPGDAVFGHVDVAGDVDAYGINLVAGVTYHFDLKAGPSNSGTLADPLLALFDPAQNKVAENNDASAGQLNSTITFTATTSGLHFLTAQANGSGTGSFVLSASGVASGLVRVAAPSLASYAGTVKGTLTGLDGGSIDLAVDVHGKLTGSVVLNRNPAVTLAVTGSVVSGGVVQFVATGTAGSFAFNGYLGPQGQLSGAWSNPAGAGGLFVGTRTEGPGPVAGAVTCYDGGVANAVGDEDPFAVNAWHLKNTGPSQVVSATGNAGAVAGIDANVANVHKLGLGCTGKGIGIAIVDSGLELAHEDYVGNLLSGKSFNFINNTDDPSPPKNAAKLDHGTGVAGVAMARGWNGKGSRGTAPFASAVGYNTVGNQPLAAGEADVSANMTYLAFGARPSADPSIPATTAFGTRADGLHIFNFSAGADYAIAPNTSTDPLARGARHRAAAYGTKTLRAGLGAIYLQAAGNEFTSMTAQTRPDGPSEAVVCSAFRADYEVGTFKNAAALTCGNPSHEPEGKPFVYQVASMHNTGRASSYSVAGSSNWITGFGGEFGGAEVAIISTDDSGCQSGGNNLANKASFQGVLEGFIRVIADLFGDSAVDPGCNYTGTMNGTSAATPSIAGITALLLEANPKLTWQDVGFIFARTARKVDVDIASGDRAVSFQNNGAAQSLLLDDPWITNSAGFNFQSRYGFGLVDADAALKLAVAYTAPAGRRANELVAESAASSDLAADAGNGFRNYRVGVSFADKAAATGQMQLDIAVTNTGDTEINQGLLQFEMVNLSTGTKSILMPAFTSWFAGGNLNKLKKGAVHNFRLHTNAFYGEVLGGDFEVRVRSLSVPAAGASHSLSFKATATSFSM